MKAEWDRSNRNYLLVATTHVPDGRSTVGAPETLELNRTERIFPCLAGFLGESFSFQPHVLPGLSTDHDFF
jgi:hypothetical protein